MQSYKILMTYAKILPYLRCEGRKRCGGCFVSHRVCFYFLTQSRWGRRMGCIALLAAGGFAECFHPAARAERLALSVSSVPSVDISCQRISRMTRFFSRSVFCLTQRRRERRTFRSLAFRVLFLNMNCHKWSRKLSWMFLVYSRGMNIIYGHLRVVYGHLR